jgi:hypothetical protein
MTAFSFKRNSAVYLVRGNSKWKIEIYPDLNFSQTFDQTGIKVKTLHSQLSLFEEASITKANTANFNFTVLLVKGSDFNIIGNWLVGVDDTLDTYDMYVSTGTDTFKLEKAVLTRGTFQILKDQLITVAVTGEATKLTRFSGEIPGTLQSRDASLDPLIVRSMRIDLDSATLPHISGVTLELSNDVSWVPYENLQKSLYVTNASDSQSPEAFVVAGKVLSGTIQQYLTETTNSRLQTWSTNSTLRIRVGDSSAYYLDVNIPSVVFTNRVNVEDVFLQTYDFRMTHSPTALGTILNYNL